VCCFLLTSLSYTIPVVSCILSGTDVEEPKHIIMLGSYGGIPRGSFAGGVEEEFRHDILYN
tara:strand:+ start:204 stop:386 length:183 start_codon:yes stop_codon:yes gene_type:complete